MKAKRIEKYSFTAGDRLLLDTNVWLFLYCPHCDPVSVKSFIRRRCERNSFSQK